ncbi:cell division ATPase MinD [Candidatus Woesearchaeota archaeon]|nr:cell division ATPase MinD [Candidatus Woesearchaeota archaeon]
MTRFVAVLSGKGGVGKTTVAINLADALNKLGRDVVILDGNLTSPDIGLSLGLADVPASLHDVMKGKKNIMNSIYLHSSGVRVIPGSMNLEAIKNMNLDSLEGVFKQLQGLSEIVLMDLEAGLGTETLSVLEFADEVLIVTSPEIAAVANALKAIKLADEMDVTVLGVVLNKVRGDSLELSEANVGTLLERPILVNIPENNDVREAKLKKQTLFINSPDSDSTNKFKKLAAYLVGEKYEANLILPKETLFQNILKKLSLK